MHDFLASESALSLFLYGMMLLFPLSVILYTFSFVRFFKSMSKSEQKRGGHRA